MKNYIRNILIFIFTFSLIFGLAIIPSFAFSFNTSSNLYIFDELDEFVDISYSISDPDRKYQLKINSGNIPAYGFWVESNHTFYVALYSNQTERLNVTYGWNDGTKSTSNWNLTQTYNNLVVYQYTGFTAGNSNYEVTHGYLFPTLNDGLDAVIAYAETPPEPEYTSYNAYFDLPAGNVAYIRTNDNNTLTLSTIMPEFSSLTGSTGTYWDNTMQIKYGVPSYPPSGTTFPLSGMSNIQWFRSTEGRDLLGRTKQALFLDTTHNSDNFIVVYNPTYRKLTTSGQGNVNTTIRIQCSELVDYHIYALTGEFNSQGTIQSYSTDNFVNPYVGTPTADNENVQGTNTNGETPIVGGSGNAIGGDGGIIEYIQSIENTLNTFASNFISLLKAPISHIQSLIAAGTDYFNMIRGLYGWLPDDVQGTINSAMIVSISVGVIALLL